jgi:ornithine carbamoyltransferase
MAVSEHSLSGKAERPKDFVSIADWPRLEIERMLRRAAQLKELRRRGELPRSLLGRSVLLYFAKPSLRTFVSFQVGVTELGGNPVFLPPEQVQIGQREPIEDVAHNLERFVHLIVARVYGHEMIEGLAGNARIPVINALSDHLHPCQAMADALTIAENADLHRARLVYLGDGNNVAHSLLHLAGRLGLRLVVCTPPRYVPDPAVVARATELAREEGGEIRLETDPRSAVKGADFLYTDVWASMGQEEEAAERAEVFRPYQINAALIAAAPDSVRVLHCLPAHRGQEISAEVFESPRSLVFDQAENRLHAQKAVMEVLLDAF